METMAVVLQEPERLSLSRLDLLPPADDDIVVEVEFSGISTGTERLFFTGNMPPFPGMGYPLVPGYESVGRVTFAGPLSGHSENERVFCPGATCFKDVRGLFGGAASQIVLPGKRAIPVDPRWEDRAVLLALAATAQHALGEGPPPDLIVGHGVLGRLLARLCLVAGGEAPTVWETNAARRNGADGYRVIHPDEDPRRNYRTICDVSGDSASLDRLISCLAPRGEIVLAGFYNEPLSFAFPPAFMREARIRVAAEWREPDIAAVTRMIAAGRLSLDGLITHRSDAADANGAYQTAFGDPDCLKMILDWRSCR
ncbi:MAG: chlorophyll synthesis pathway protein BchC [Pseudorhodoplanes sp.]